MLNYAQRPAMNALYLRVATSHSFACRIPISASFSRRRTLRPKSGGMNVSVMYCRFFAKESLAACIREVLSATYMLSSKRADRAESSPVAGKHVRTAAVRNRPAFASALSQAAAHAQRSATAPNVKSRCIRRICDRRHMRRQRKASWI
jgi:hypothetical protein